MSAVILSYIIVFTIVLKDVQSINLLPYPLDKNRYVKDPLVVLLVKNEGPKLDEEETNINIEEEAKYVFYNYLRTSPEEEEDPHIKEYKENLRSALRARCRKVEKCVKKCPKKKPSCPFNCQAVFDNLNLCEPERNECDDRPRCGKTMPPKWKI